MPTSNILIVSGSHSPDSQSSRFADYLRSRLSMLGVSELGAVSVHDLGSEPLPLWQSGVSYSYADEVARADAVILISPEWHGMATPALKNWFLFMEMDWLSHKPVLLCGVSGGSGGLYPVLELRSFSFKNFRPNYMPDQLVVRDVQAVIRPGEAEDKVKQFRQRVDYTLLVLQAYIQGFVSIRNALPKSNSAFQYGL